MTHFCTQCGHPVAYRIPEGDNRHRHICQHCQHIHYQNPKLVAGVIATWNDQVLLCKRAIEPRMGYWTLPAGFMENGESTSAAAAREAQEEACATIVQLTPFAMFSMPEISQVHLFYRGQIEDGHHQAGEESLETGLFSEADIPWDALAFRSVANCLQAFFRDRSEGSFRFHEATLFLSPERY